MRPQNTFGLPEEKAALLGPTTLALNRALEEFTRQNPDATPEEIEKKFDEVFAQIKRQRPLSQDRNLDRGEGLSEEGLKKLQARISGLRVIDGDNAGSITVSDLIAAAAPATTPSEAGASTLQQKKGRAQ